jgi:hypothetical protein
VICCPPFNKPEYPGWDGDQSEEERGENAVREGCEKAVGWISRRPVEDLSVGKV